MPNLTAPSDGIGRGSNRLVYEPSAELITCRQHVINRYYR